MEHAITDAIWSSGCCVIDFEQPITLATGTLSPIYVDMRRLMFHPANRQVVINGLVETVKNVRNHQAQFVISGTATADIPFATGVALKLNKPMVYIREPKQHGLRRAIEGGNVSRCTVIHVSDLITTGSQGVHAIEVLRQHGATVAGYVTILCRSEAGLKAIASLDVPVACLIGLEDFLAQALDRGYLTPDKKAQLDEYLADPVRWSTLASARVSGGRIRM